LSLVRKSEFAEMRGVSPGRVSQWIAAGQIDGAAIVGSGQRGLINVDLACAQLQERLATDERYGLNGLSTNISTTTISPRPARANSETFRHRIPAEADALEAPSARRRMRQKPRGRSRPPRRKIAARCQPVRVDQVVRRLSAKASPPAGGPFHSTGRCRPPAPGCARSRRADWRRRGDRC
jgi:hypothetical protein